MKLYNVSYSSNSYKVGLLLAQLGIRQMGFHIRTRLISSSSSKVRGQSSFNNRDKLRSASSFPPVWHFAQ